MPFVEVKLLEMTVTDDEAGRTDCPPDHRRALLGRWRGGQDQTRVAEALGFPARPVAGPVDRSGLGGVEFVGGQEERCRLADGRRVIDPSSTAAPLGHGCRTAADLDRDGQDRPVHHSHSIPEAVFLSDRIVGMSPWRGRVVAEVDVSLHRPRTDETRSDAPYCQLQLVTEAGARAPAD